MVDINIELTKIYNIQMVSENTDDITFTVSGERLIHIDPESIKSIEEQIEPTRFCVIIDDKALKAYGIFTEESYKHQTSNLNLWQGEHYSVFDYGQYDAAELFLDSYRTMTAIVPTKDNNIHSEGK